MLFLKKNPIYLKGHFDLLCSVSALFGSTGTAKVSAVCKLSWGVTFRSLWKLLSAGKPRFVLQPIKWHPFARAVGERQHFRSEASPRKQLCCLTVADIWKWCCWNSYVLKLPLCLLGSYRFSRCYAQKGEGGRSTPTALFMYWSPVNLDNFHVRTFATVKFKSL